MKTSLSRIFVTLIAVTLFLASLQVLSVKAQQETIIVPDNHPTIQEAIDIAKDGDTIFIKSGIYNEQSIVINKPISLIGENPKTTILQGPKIEYPITKKEPNNKPDFTLLNSKTSINFLPPITIIIQIKADNVEISGFTLTNAYTGISATGNKTKITQNNFIDTYNNALNIKGHYTTITQNNITGTVQCTGNYNIISSNNLNFSHPNIKLKGDLNIIQNNNINNRGYGIEIIGNQNLIAKNCLTGDLETGSEGIVITQGINNEILKNIIKNNYFSGILIQTGINNSIHKNTITENRFGLVIVGYDNESGNNTVFQNNFINNTQQAKVDYLPALQNRWDDSKEGNYWVDYNGTDSNSDGIGDTPYLVEAYKWDNDVGGEASFVSGQDNFPLMEPYDFENDKIVLPSVLPFAAFIVIVSFLGLGIFVFFKKNRGKTL